MNERELDLTDTVNEIIDTLEGMYHKKMSEADDRSMAELIFLSGLIGAAIQLAVENNLSRKDVLKIAYHLYNENVRLRKGQMN
jgi:hypothetical protein